MKSNGGFDNSEEIKQWAIFFLKGGV